MQRLCVEQLEGLHIHPVSRGGLPCTDFDASIRNEGTNNINDWKNLNQRVLTTAQSYGEPARTRLQNQIKAAQATVNEVDRQETRLGKGKASLDSILDMNEAMEKLRLQLSD